MDIQISKKQFIIITILIIVITVVAISLVIKNKTNSENNVQTNNPTISKTEKPKDTVIKNENDNKDKETTIENEKEENKVEDNKEKEEEEINTSTKGTKLASVINDIEQSGIFNKMIEPTPDEIDDFMDIDLSLLDEYVIKMSDSRFEADLYMILKPSTNNEETVMNQVKSFLINYENSWVNIDYKKYDLISNRKAIKRNGYLIYVVSSDNDKFLDIVRNNI